MLVMIIIGWLITVAGFLLWVRHLRNLHQKVLQDEIVRNAREQATIKHKAGWTFTDSPIANSEPYTPSNLPAMLAPIKKPKKVFSQKPKTGKQRKTVTVKKRVTK